MITDFLLFNWAYFMQRFGIVRKIHHPFFIERQFKFMVQSYNSMIQFFCVAFLISPFINSFEGLVIYMTAS